MLSQYHTMFDAVSNGYFFLSKYKYVTDLSFFEVIKTICKKNNMIKEIFKSKFLNIFDNAATSKLIS